MQIQKKKDSFVGQLNKEYLEKYYSLPLPPNQNSGFWQSVHTYIFVDNKRNLPLPVNYCNLFSSGNAEFIRVQKNNMEADILETDMLSEANEKTKNQLVSFIQVTYPDLTVNVEFVEQQ